MNRYTNILMMKNFSIKKISVYSFKNFLECFKKINLVLYKELIPNKGNILKLVLVEGFVCDV